MMSKVASVILMIGLSGCAASDRVATAFTPFTQSVTLDFLLAFSNPRLCELSANHAELLSGLAVFGEDEDGYDNVQLGGLAAPAWALSAFGVPERRRFDGWTMIHLPVVNGTLFGLPLAAID